MSITVTINDVVFVQTDLDSFSSSKYGALLVPPACVYTFLLFWRDFFASDPTLVFIRVSGATFFIWRDVFFFLARLFFISRDLTYLARLFFLATESNRFPSSP